MAQFRDYVSSLAVVTDGQQSQLDTEFKVVDCVCVLVWEHYLITV